MLLNVDAHNVSIRNIKVSKRERHKTYCDTKHTHFLELLHCVQLRRFVTLCHVAFTLCCFTLCSNIVDTAHSNKVMCNRNKTRPVQGQQED